MMDNTVLFKAILARVRSELVPKLRVVPKKSVWIHAAINFILNIVYPKDQKDSYITRFTTTLGYTIALAGSEGEDPDQFGAWETLCHETKHAVQGKKWTRALFAWLYMFPLSLGIMFLLFGWVGLFWMSAWWQKLIFIAAWVTLSGVCFIPQLPDPWRKRWEMQAYAISMHLHCLIHNKISNDYLDRLVDNFHSMAYYIMAPNEAKIRKELNQLRILIHMGRSPAQNEPIIRIAEEEFGRLLSRS